MARRENPSRSHIIDHLHLAAEPDGVRRILRDSHVTIPLPAVYRSAELDERSRNDSVLVHHFRLTTGLLEVAKLLESRRVRIRRVGEHVVLLLLATR